MEVKRMINDEIIQFKEEKSRQTFITSDQHFGHFNIIKYCNRPFETLEDMNEILLHNWNSTIRPKDKVYFLGDLAFGKNSKTDDWLEQLNGDITFFVGNHDASNDIEFVTCAIVKLGDIPFYMTHDPGNVPDFWRGWVIHGHHHNNLPNEYPFVNSYAKTINVSVELTNYTPINKVPLLATINTRRLM
jgi:calcineurin-like phosphoesterase family protein